ncbi:YceI family protein [Larkinella rosea]|uniref:YceI family protein n=1 Tax=Larkinella rosea TaxID=2025312 RepID=A0A3P1BPR2_9BACT|nr:YceI family protein [Larkinella rosea]RRB02534.1 YceI family protein [Larkinella rosea]
MKTNQIVAGFLAVVMLTAAPLMTIAGTNGPEKRSAKTVAKPVTYAVDPEQSTVVWNSKKVGGEHTGNIKLAKGEFVFDGKKLTAGNFTADMTTLSENKNSERVVNHLKSDDFFGVEKNPTATFKITKVEAISGAKAGEPNYNVTGDLMIKGTTKPITFPAVVKQAGDDVEATAKLTVNRLEYDIKYRAAIIGTAADRIIEDTFSLDLKLVGKKSKPM